ncbi:MAG: hypothetical protein ACYC9Y_13270 [Candidatus Methylomirabilia bacterium]
MKPKVVAEELSGAQSRKYLVRIRTANAEYEGTFHSPYPDKRLSDVLTRMEQFINLKEAKDIVSGDTFPFMVISKTSIETIKVVKEWV